MTEKFGRLALHMWTIDTTPLATALDAAKQSVRRHIVAESENKAGTRGHRVEERLEVTVEFTVRVRGGQHDGRDAAPEAYIVSPEPAYFTDVD